MGGRLIDADALKKRVSELIVPDWTRTLIRSWLDSEPTVDAVPVVHGEWIFNGRFAELNHYACSNCNRTEFRMSDYCPNCGAKMDGETEYANTYSLGKIEMPKGAIEQIIADGERRDGADDERTD